MSSKRKHKQQQQQQPTFAGDDQMDANESEAAATASRKRSRTSTAAARSAAASSSSAAVATAAASSASSAASSASSSSIASPAAIARVQLAPKRVLRTLELIDLMQATEGPLVPRVKRVIDLLTEGAESPDEFAMFDFSLREEPGSPAAWFLFLRFYVRSCGAAPGDTEEIQQHKTVAHTLLTSAVEPLLPRLLASFDPALTDPATGNNALQDLLRVMYPLKTSWIVILIKAMAKRGVSLAHLNQQGRTPMHVVASVLSPPHSSAYFAPLLGSLGGDINAQDGAGDTVLHILIRGRALAVLQDLFAHADAGCLEYHAKNNAGQTPVELAAAMHEGPSGTDDTRKIHRLLAAQAACYSTQIKPIIIAELMEFNVKDIALIIMAYLDGSGPPFAKAKGTEEEDKEEEQTAAASGAADH